MHLDKDYHLLILNLFSHNLELFQLSSVQATVDAREPIRNLLHKVHEGARFMYRVPTSFLREFVDSWSWWVEGDSTCSAKRNDYKTSFIY